MNSSHQSRIDTKTRGSKISRDLLNPCLDPSFLKIELFESSKFFLDAFILFLFSFFFFCFFESFRLTIYILPRLENLEREDDALRRRRKTIEFTPDLRSGPRNSRFGILLEPRGNGEMRFF